MKKSELMKSASLTFNKIGFKIQKKSPELLVVVGIVGIVVSTAMACKATTKAGEIANETKASIDEIHSASENGVTKAGETYTAEDTKKDLTITYIQTGVKFARLYAPATILGFSSIACIILSHRILKKRNVALAAAYTALDQSFKDYRGRVIDRFGEAVEKELRYNIKAKEVERIVVDENGAEKTIKEIKSVTPSNWDPSHYSPYARLYDDKRSGWMKDPEVTRMFLKNIQTQANNKLSARGHLFLNDIYEMLGYPLTDYGQTVGWIYDLKYPNGDNFVDFGIFDVLCERDPEDGGDYIEGFILDFNVAGDITGDLATHQYI